MPIINGTWVPPLWFGLICFPLGILVFFVALHVLNAWSWVCARWAEVMFRGPGLPGRTGRDARAAATAGGPLRPGLSLRSRRRRLCRRPPPQRRWLRRRRPAPAPAASAAAPEPATPADVPSDDKTTS